ncbi:MAG: tRNA lysidine(34) synthetase TilS [Sedimentitalea sp.]
MTDADAHILATVRKQFRAAPPTRLGVAVSGGGDSVALLHILSRCFEPGTVEVIAATVDHGLRDTKQELAQVRDFAESLNIQHTVLRWRGWQGAGNLQNEARKARYELLADWAKSQDLCLLALGHTTDDQAETVLMRLARSSGVDGIAAMQPRRTQFGMTFVRPVMGLGRDELRAYLQRNNLDWSEDPSNHDMRFDRIKARRAMGVLQDMGITAQTLTDVAHNMSKARQALEWYSFLAARDVASINGGDVCIDVRQFRILPEEIARRVLVRAVQWIGGHDYPPRRGAVDIALRAVRGGTSSTLGGCRIVFHNQHAWICREYQAVRGEISSPGDTWDTRWRIHGHVAVGDEVRAVGRAGLGQCEDWRATGRPQAGLVASPAVWRGQELVAAPLAGMTNGFTAELLGGGEEFFASLLSH